MGGRRGQNRFPLCVYHFHTAVPCRLRQSPWGLPACDLASRVNARCFMWPAEHLGGVVGGGIEGEGHQSIGKQSGNCWPLCHSRATFCFTNEGAEEKGVCPSLPCWFLLWIQTPGLAAPSPLYHVSCCPKAGHTVSQDTKPVCTRSIRNCLQVGKRCPFLLESKFG